MRQYVDSVGLGSYGTACRFIVTFLKGQAQTWWRMFAIENQVAGTSSIFDTLDVDTLLNELETQFSDVDRELRLRDKLINLKQRGTVAEYTQQFKELQIELGPKRLDDDTAFHVYQAGLEPVVRLQVMLKDPKTMTDLQLYAERYARAHKAFQASQGSSEKRDFQKTFPFRGGQKGGFRGGFRGGNNQRGGFQKRGGYQPTWGGNNGQGFRGKYNPHHYSQLSQYSNSRQQGPLPMVVNNVTRGGKRGGKFDGNCNFCGKYGHMERDCFSKQRNSGQQQPANHNNGGKGKGVAFNNVLQHSEQSFGPPYFVPQLGTLTHQDVVPQGTAGTAGSTRSWNASAQPSNSILKTQSKN